MTNISESDIVPIRLEHIFIKTEKPEKNEVKHILVPDLPYENLVYCAECHKNICICEAEQLEEQEEVETEEPEEQEEQEVEAEPEEEQDESEVEEVETEQQGESEVEEQGEAEQEEVEEQGEAEQEEVEEQGESEVEEQGEAEQEEVEAVQSEEVEEQDEQQVETEQQGEEEEESVEEVTIQGKRYYATNTKNGDIYEIDEDENPGEVVGKYVNGVPEFISQEQQDEEQEEQQEEEQQEEEEESVEEVTIQGQRYYVTNTRDGLIYSVMDDDDVGPEVGKYVNGKPVFNK